MQGKGTTHPSSRLPCGFVPHLPGIPSVRGIVYNWDGDDTEYLEGLFRKQGEQIACLIIDPPALTEPIRDKLALARRLTKKYGAVLIYDEVKTGFRVSLGGVQEYYGIRPDLTTLSKAMANGFPLAAILGKKKIMQHNPYIWGTFIGDVLAVVASLKTIEILERRNSIKFLWGMGERLIGGLNRIISGLGIEEHVSAVGWNWPTMPFVLFKGKGEAAEEVKKTFYKVITGRGVLMYATHMNFINLSHTAADLSDTLTICEEGLKAAKAGWRKS
jgi:glutamate-1-semialdehyde aminotransferase